TATKPSNETCASRVRVGRRRRSSFAPSAHTVMCALTGQNLRRATGQPRPRTLRTKGTPMADAPTVEFERRMLIDGKLVDGDNGTFTNINPATEEVLGDVADASKDDMQRAIDAARRAFDDSDWS